MTPADFRATRKAMGYTQAQMAEFLYRAKSTVEKWEAGTIPIDPLAGKYLDLCGEFDKLADTAYADTTERIAELARLKEGYAKLKKQLMQLQRLDATQ